MDPDPYASRNYIPLKKRLMGSHITNTRYVPIVNGSHGGNAGPSVSISSHLNFVANIDLAPPSLRRLMISNSRNIPLRAIDIMSGTQHDAAPKSEFGAPQSRSCEINILALSKRDVYAEIMLQSVYAVIILIACRCFAPNIPGAGKDGLN